MYCTIIPLYMWFLALLVCSDYKGILEGSTVIWTCDWRSEALLNSARYSFAGSPHVEEIEESLRCDSMNF